MITISDLNVSRETCLTELKDAEMMGHIIGGWGSIKPIFKLQLTQNRRFQFGTISFDINGNGVIDANESGPIFSGHIQSSVGFEFDH
ncbi:MAG: hypothetical protein F6K55_25990 [Moorea sp. SIO4A3]|nr:hypothetical protein [Moorena sp. SIO4A3]